MIKRQPDGLSWIVLLNTSAWNGPEIHTYINRMMAGAVSKIDEWPEYNLLDNTLPVPIRFELTGIN